MLYANYIRNKMHHLVKSVFASGYPLKIISKFKKKAVGYTIHGKTEIGKNLIPYPYMYTTRTVNGVTYTDNGDGSVTVSGTATGYSDFFFKIMSIAPNTMFTFSKNQSDDAANMAFILRQLDENRALIGTEITLIPTVTTHTFTTAENARYIQIACKRYANAECKGTYKPMLELGDTATEYEPYTEYGVGDKTKNLIPYPYSGFGGAKTKTINGVTFTDNGDGSITVNGTSTLKTFFDVILNNDIIGEIDKTKTYTMSMPGAREHNGNIALGLYKGSTWVDNVCSLGYPTKDFSSYEKEFDRVQIKLIINVNASFENFIFKPMLEIGNTATDYEPYGYKIPLVNRGKNLLPYPYHETTLTKNGVTFTDNGDGTITVSGTPTASISYYLGQVDVNPGEKYCLSGMDIDKNLVFILIGYSADGTKLSQKNSRLISYTAENNAAYVKMWIDRINSNVEIPTNIVKPQLELGNTATEYEPYRAPDTTNVYHTTPLKDGDSISYKADGLPELQLYKGENNITADTAVAPSAIDIKYLN